MRSEYEDAIDTRCRECGSYQVLYQIITSDDIHYLCACGHSWWVDGDDG